MSTQETGSPFKRRKLRRVTRACDFCHRRGMRCSASRTDPEKCQNCIEYDESCTYLRPAKRRGIPKAGDRTPAVARRDSSPRDQSDVISSARYKHAESWKVPTVPDSQVIDSLASIYLEIIYPIFPLFHRPSLLRRVSQRDYLTNRSFYATVMAMCALASARARDGAWFFSQYSTHNVNLESPSSEEFQNLAENAIPANLEDARGLDYMRAYALLSLTSIQYGNILSMHKYLGAYLTLVGMDGLHDESRWPNGLTVIEVEERRRLFWSIYTLDIFSSVAFGSVPHSREAHTSVIYPYEIEDDDIQDSGYIIRPASTRPSSMTSSINNIQSSTAVMQANSWLRGWNFTTDLYRILEHAVDNFRRSRLRHSQPGPLTVTNISIPLGGDVMEHVMRMYAELPQRFKETRAISLDPHEDIYSFQAANIVATLQLLRMVLFATEDSTVEQKCRVSGELLDSLANVPLEYLRAISAPLVHHIAGIGSILGSVIEGPLSEPSYARVRTVLLAMADLLDGLELSLHSAAGASTRLREHVVRIDEYMQVARQQAFLKSSTTLTSSVPAPSTSNPSMTANIPGSQYSLDLERGSLGPGDRVIVNIPEMDGRAGTMQDVGGSTEGLGDALLDPGSGFEFQLPPELLEDWPWPLDMGGMLL